MPRALEIALHGPIGPQRLRDDTVVIADNGWYRTLTPSASWAAANEVLFPTSTPHDQTPRLTRLLPNITSVICP
ncbi:MAG: hypothetical protein U0Y68_16650 [Blastocatellia bacterium]